MKTPTICSYPVIKKMGWGTGELQYHPQNVGHGLNFSSPLLYFVGQKSQNGINIPHVYPIEIIINKPQIHFN